MLLQKLNCTVEIISMMSGSWLVTSHYDYCSGILLVAGSQATRQRLENHASDCCHEEEFGLLNLDVAHRKRRTVFGRFFL